ncbi:hypothetical protein ACHAWF_011641 [Thalassiosira exigua]
MAMPKKQPPPITRRSSSSSATVTSSECCRAGGSSSPPRSGRSRAALPVEDLVYGSESPVASSDVERHLTSARKRRRPVRHLGFLGCRFRGGTPRAFRAVGRRLRRTRSDVRELAVRGVPNVGNEELKSLAPFLNASATLRSLDLTGTRFDARALEEVKPFFRRCSSLEVLVVGENECVGDEGVEVLASSLGEEGRGRLRVLAVESCGVGPRGASSVADFMARGGAGLRVLELSGNPIGDEGGEVLAAALKRGHPLGELSLNGAELGDRGALALGDMLKANRSLHTLSLQDNAGITGAGASGLLEAIYDADSIKTIVASNHALKNLSLRGCRNIASDLLGLVSQLSTRSRLLSTKDEVIRFKVSAYLKNSEGGVALEDFDLELMPRILSFVGKSNGMTSLFHTLKSMPLLYAQYSPQGKTLVEREEDEGRAKEGEAGEARTDGAGDFLRRLRLSSRRARKYYAIFRDLVPKRSSMLRHPDRRARSGHEPPSDDDDAASNSSDLYLSSSGHAASDFECLNSYYAVLEQALVLWLFHTRRALGGFACTVLKLCPQVLLAFRLCCPKPRGAVRASNAMFI